MQPAITVIVFESWFRTMSPPGKTIDEELKDLAETWNPLLDPDGRKDLVLDVNSLVRHFMRPVGRSLVDRPLDELRLHALVEQLSMAKNLAKIKKRAQLMRYLELCNAPLSRSSSKTARGPTRFK